VKVKTVAKTEHPRTPSPVELLEDDAALSRELLYALAWWRFKPGSAQLVVNWAAHALVTHDGPSLRILAGLSSPYNEFEVDEWLVKVSKELGVLLPSSDQLLHAYCALVAEDIVNNRITPLDGCETIYGLFVMLGYPEALASWTGLDDEVQLAHAGVRGTLADAEASIRAEAHRMLGTCETDKLKR
jgi:hypothetical protein